jgi:putative transcriptional regulator
MDSVKGSFLIASPGLLDPNFARTVVLIAEHTPEGSFGLVLNRPGSLKLAELWATLAPAESCPSEAVSFAGGPVQPSSVFLLHTCADLAEGAEPILPGLYLGSDVDLLRKLLEREEALRAGGERRELFRVFCGYSGWGEGQLDGELKAGGWLVQPATLELVFSSPPATLWARSMERQGGPYRFFSMMPPNPEYN